MKPSILTQTTSIVMLLTAFTFSGASFSADDPSIKGDLRKHVQQSMAGFIKEQTIDEHLYIYDAVKGKLLKLKLAELHSGIVKKGDFYVSCADFIDQNGNKVDIDFMVRESNNSLITTQALVHSINGKKRQYHLERL